MAVQHAAVEISLNEMIKCLWDSRLKILFWIFLFACLSISVALYLPNKYESTTTVIVSKDTNEGLGALASSFGGLAGLAGVNLNSGQSSRNALIAKELLKSKAFLVEFIKKNGFVVPLLAAESWDKKTKTLMLDDEIYDEQSKTWLAGRVDNEITKPLDVDIFIAFLDIFTLDEDSKTGVLTFSIEFFSPQYSQKWLEMLVSEVNKTIKVRDIEQSRKNIDFLENLANNTPNSSLKQTFYNLIEEQSKTLMLAELQEEYVFQTVDPPDFPEKKSSPKRALIVIFATILGGLLSAIFILFIGASSGRFNIPQSNYR